MGSGAIPGWLGPIVGAALGVLLAWRVFRREGEEFTAEHALYGAVLGALAVGVVWVWDVLKRRGKRDDEK